MELRHLRYFVALAEEENFHRAAERLFISQSPLSRQMQDLQEELGVKLLEPAGRGVKLTPAGVRFAEQARKILESAALAVDEARAIAKGQLGVIKIGYEQGTAFFGYLTSVLRQFKKVHPKIDIHLQPLSSVEQVEALKHKFIDVGYSYYISDDEAINNLLIFTDRLGVVMSSDHCLAKKKSLKMQDLASESLILQPRRSYPQLHDDIITATNRTGISLKVVSEFYDLEAILTLVSVSLDAITFLPERDSIVLPLCSEVWKPVSDLEVFTQNVMMWRRNDDNNPLVQALISIAEQLRRDI